LSKAAASLFFALSAFARDWGAIGFLYEHRGGGGGPPPWGPCQFTKTIRCQCRIADYACFIHCIKNSNPWPPPFGVTTPNGSNPISPAVGAVQAIAPGVFLGHVMDRAGTQIGPTTDFDGLAAELTAATGSPTLVLSGPPEFFVSTNPPPVTAE
jgi:hypothetical protein